MKPIGGYFELERGYFQPRYKGIYLNSGCNALRMIIRELKIKRLHVPYYTCPVVPRTVMSEGCEVVPYELDEKFRPACRFPKDDFILVNDYFGVTGRNVAELAAAYPNLIVDNAQSYFSAPLGRAVFYSPRKFFGVPDGGIAVFNRDEVKVVSAGEPGENSALPLQLETRPNLEVDQSYSRMAHLLKRHDCGASAAYGDFKAAEESIGAAPIRVMSNLTRSILSTIDDERVRSRRLANFSYLYNRLGTCFPLAPLPEAAPLVFPFVTSDLTLRKRLIDAQIFVATYWPGCVNCESLKESILPLPIDQRYDEHDMKRMKEVMNA